MHRVQKEKIKEKQGTKEEMQVVLGSANDEDDDHEYDDEEGEEQEESQQEEEQDDDDGDDGDNNEEEEEEEENHAISKSKPSLSSTGTRGLQSQTQPQAPPTKKQKTNTPLSLADQESLALSILGSKSRS